MIFNAHAKLNLTLRVIARETTGYHQIESLFCALDLCDEVEVDRQTHGIRVDVIAPDAADTGITAALNATPRDNLVYRAARAYLDTTGLDGGAGIRLIKRIPSGAGLGGGSSDAAATLAALNELYGRALDGDAMLALAGSLGSDVPFFMCGSPLALAWGRGTRMLPLPALEQKPVVLVAPGESVATGEAYEALAALRSREYTVSPVIHRAAALRAWHDVAYNAVNDFEPVIFERIPELARVKADLSRHGALIAQLTGTGSVVFGIFNDDAGAESAAAAIRNDFRNVRTIVTRTLS